MNGDESLTRHLVSGGTLPGWLEAHPENSVNRQDVFRVAVGIMRNTSFQPETKAQHVIDVVNRAKLEWPALKCGAHLPPAFVNTLERERLEFNRQALVATGLGESCLPNKEFHDDFLLADRLNFYKKTVMALGIVAALVVTEDPFSSIDETNRVLSCILDAMFAFACFALSKYDGPMNGMHRLLKCKRLKEALDKSMSIIDGWCSSKNTVPRAKASYIIMIDDILRRKFPSWHRGDVEFRIGNVDSMVTPSTNLVLTALELAE